MLDHFTGLCEDTTLGIPGSPTSVPSEGLLLLIFGNLWLAQPMADYGDSNNGLESDFDL